MPGQFKKAPLVYVTARIRTTGLPPLTVDQLSRAQQAMMRVGLVNAERSQSELIDFRALAEITSAEHRVEKLTTSIHRHGYFTADRTSGLILDHDGIEWRASRYTKYQAFASGFEKALHALLDAVDVLGCVVTQEFTLSYADVIAPAAGRSLSEYFSASERILPLSFLAKDHNDVQRVGHVQITRITAPTQKITISLEQLPAQDRKVGKFLPEVLREPDGHFAMPIAPHEAWSALGTNDYGLLMTQAGMLSSSELSFVDFPSTLEQLHGITRETFLSLINRSVCNEDWQYESEEGGHP